MTLLHRVASILRWMFRRNRAEQDLNDELQVFVDMAAADRMRDGVPPADARRLAVLDLGGVEQAKEHVRTRRHGAWLDSIGWDLGYGLRRLRAHPGYALAAVFTLALGVGGTASTFGAARAVLLDPLPYPRPGEIGVFWKKTDWTEEELLSIRGRTPGFRHVALYRQRDVILRDGDEPARLLPGVTASAELFDVLGAGPLLGRAFRTGDDVPGAEPVAILSFGLWQELGGHPSIIGTRVTVDGTPRTVIGVMPRRFWFPDPSVRIWTPVPLSPELRSWNSTLVGRVAPGHTPLAMEAPVAQLTAMLGERFDYPAQWDKTRNAHITPLRDDSGAAPVRSRRESLQGN